MLLNTCLREIGYLTLYVCVSYLLYTVKSVLRGHLWEREKVALQDR
jgi:hypothetical protein